MENHNSNLLNCCFCDKNLSPGSQDNSKPIVKYRCPACDRIYCSANCCSGHKDKFDCPGIRNKTPYVHLSKFDQKQFLDDYFFLEEVNNKIESSQKVLPVLASKIKTKSKNKKRKFNRRNRKKQSEGGAQSKQIPNDSQQK